ncbi:Hypothetical predicted protein [Paramuricea clavata]|uniref:Uncharacterized protein n=1 Tax=Paramuricea clavata TaxID=317549 RepID=A0A7D9EUP5_PARCT|nr:Hypothetical predicted protein [Paramuricea clavata]
MKFSQVFVVLSVLFAISFGIPANWKENEDVMASNDGAVQEKRFALTAWLAKKALGAAVSAACNFGNLPDQMKGVCKCASLVVGRDEEFEAEKRWFISDPVGKLKSTVKDVCDKFGVVLSGPCGCILPFI